MIPASATPSSRGSTAPSRASPSHVRPGQLATFALALAACTSSSTTSPAAATAPAPRDTSIAGEPHAAPSPAPRIPDPPVPDLPVPDPPAPVTAALRRLPLQAVIDLSAGTCAITTGGRVQCRQADRWRPIPGLRDVVELAGGDNHTCARTSAGAVHCWGEWYFGPAHHDGDESDFLRVARPRRIAGLSARALASWEDRDYAVGTDGALWIWGRRPNKSLTPERSEPPSDLVDFSRAPWWECRQRADATAHCENTVIPAGAPPFDLDAVASISLSDRGGCSLHHDGRARCWGRAPVGDDSRSDRPAPVLIPDLTDAIQISVGHEHTCALATDATVRCWGDNREGELGDGTTSDRLRPTRVPLADVPGRVVGVVALADATAVWTEGGEVWTWGAPW